MDNLTGRAARRGAAKEAWRAWTGPRTTAFVDFWRSTNDPDHTVRLAHQQKNSLKRRQVSGS